MKRRIDQLMVERGLVKSRERAQALIMGGKVEVGGMVVSKAGSGVDVGADIVLKAPDIPFVSRGGIKLDYALVEFDVNVEGKTAIDVGASTGGFTDCLLQRGGVRVYALDVGYGQLDYKLRVDSRVITIERTNVRFLSSDCISELVDIVTIDVSFISLQKVVPVILDFLKDEGELVCLIKPQFESSREEVSKGGIVRDEGVRAKAVEGIVEFFGESGLLNIKTCTSPIKGQKGNVEFFIYAKKGYS